MSQPQAYERQTDFTERDGDDTDHAALNQELDAAALSINEIRGNLALIQRDDGGLKNAVVTPDSLAPETFIALQGNVAGAVAAAEAAALSALTSAITANTAKDATVLLAAATQTSQIASALNAGTASAAAVTATAQAVISGDQAGLAVAQAGIATAGAGTATAAAATATAQAVIATNQAGISFAQAGISIAKAGEASASAGAAATDRALAQAAAASITAQVAVATHAATSKTMPVDADELPLADSAASYGLKKLTWANLKSTLAAVFLSKIEAQNQSAIAYVTTGTNTNYTVTATPALSGYAKFQSFFIELHTQSGANPTLNIAGVGATLNLVRRLQGGAYVNYSSIPAGAYRVTLVSVTQALVENVAPLIVAPVSQTSGVPTGGIVETGSGAQGEFTKWADGTMICRFRRTDSASIGSAFQGAFISGGFNWVFPAAFAPGSTPHCSVQPYALSAVGAQIASTTTNTSASYVYQSNASQPGGDRYCELFAIGTWF